MISRRALILGVAAWSPLCSLLRATDASTGQEEAVFDQLTYPPIEALDNPQPFGYNPPTEAQKQKAKDIINGTPKGPAPIDLAQSFVDRFYRSDPDAISQWPAPASWNPLIVEFFSATSIRANNDMIAWCAAFVNWCIERTSRNGSRSASSQSFISKDFKATQNPAPGDVAVFTCHDKQSDSSLGIGHVAFYKENLPNGRIRVVGGNQSSDRHSSIISESVFSIAATNVRRHVGNEYVSCTMRLNTYIKIV